MRRQSKVLLGVVLAVALHGLLLLAFVPRLEGLLPEGEGLPLTAAAPAATELPVFEPPPEDPLEIAWPEEEPAPKAAKRKPNSPKRPDPATVDVSDSAASVGATPVASSDGVKSADASYAQKVRQHLGAFAGALPPGAQGEARVQFVVMPDGRVSQVQLVQRSGHDALDEMALSLPRQAQPLPLPGPQPQRLEVPLQAVAAGP